MEIKSLLSNVTRAELITDPFPHILVRNPLDDEIASQLIAEFPSVETISPGANLSSNRRFSYSSAKTLSDPNVAPIWKEFVKAQTSGLFLQHFINIFSDEILRYYPTFQDQFGRFEDLRSGVKHRDDFSNADVLLDSQVCLNTPVINKPSLVRGSHRGPHVDSPDKLFVGLFYLRSDEDDSTGGDLDIYGFKKKPYGFVNQAIPDRYLQRLQTIKYERNVLILFLNTVNAIHGVSMRSPTNAFRYFVHMSGTVKQPLFNLEQYQENEWDARRHELAESAARSVRQMKKRLVKMF